MKKKFRTCYSDTVNCDIGFEHCPILTDSSFKDETTVEYMLANGLSNPSNVTPVYGVQDYSSLAELMNSKIEILEKFNMLSDAEKLKYGNVKNYYNSLFNQAPAVDNPPVDSPPPVASEQLDPPEVT